MIHRKCGTYLTVRWWECPSCGEVWCPTCRMLFRPSVPEAATGEDKP